MCCSGNETHSTLCWAGVDPLTLLVAANVKRLRDAAVPKMSQERLGELAGVHKNTINRLETGKQTIELPTLMALAEALGVAVADLIAAPVEETPTSEAVTAYQRSPWAALDIPQPHELVELSGPHVLRSIGAHADAEAVHYQLLAIRRRQKRGSP